MLIIRFFSCVTFDGPALTFDNSATVRRSDIGRSQDWLAFALPLAKLDDSGISRSRIAFLGVQTHGLDVPTLNSTQLCYWLEADPELSFMYFW